MGLMEVNREGAPGYLATCTQRTNKVQRITTDKGNAVGGGLNGRAQRTYPRHCRLCGVAPPTYPPALDEAAEIGTHDKGAGK